MSPSPSDEPAGARVPRVVITAGPTWEPIDQVRYLGNRSSGRMGIALAEAAYAHGCAVRLLLGPVPGPAPGPPSDGRENARPRVPPDPPANQGPGPECESAGNGMAFAESPETVRADGSEGTALDSRWSVTRFQSTADLERLLTDAWPAADLLVMAAAVADYRPAGASGAVGKLPRTADGLTLHLEPTPDLGAACAAAPRRGRRIVGFALETADTLAERSAAKLRRKRLDAIVANPLETMDAPTVTAVLQLADGRAFDAPPNLPKRAFATWLIERLASFGWLDPRRDADSI